jgi:hypothetical protein
VANPSVAANVVKHTKMDTFEIIFIAMEALQELALRDAAEKHEQKATIKRTEHQNTWKMGFPNLRRGLEILKFERDIDGNVACVNAEPWLHLKSENNFGTINAASIHTGRVLYSDHYTHKVLPMLAWINHFMEKSLKSLDMAVMFLNPSMEDPDDTALAASLVQLSISRNEEFAT